MSSRHVVVDKPTEFEGVMASPYVLSPPKRSSPRRPHKPSSGSAAARAESEIERLKSKLKEQEARLNSPPKSGTPNSHGIAAHPSPPSGGVLHGSPYAGRPYRRIISTVVYEPFSQDQEVVEWADKIKLHEVRIQQRQNEMKRNWGKDRQSTATIKPPEPKALTWTDEQVLQAEKDAAAKKEAKEAEILGNETQSAVFNASAGRPPTDPNASTSSRPSSRPPSGHRGAKDMMQRRTSAVKSNQVAQRILNSIEMNSVDVVIPSPSEVDTIRDGTVLGSNTILKRDLYEGAFTRRDMMGVISGAPYFRMIPRFNIGGVAQGHDFGLRSLVNEIGHNATDGILWINLREEPIVYINGRSFTVRDASDPLKPMINPGIASERLEAVETRLTHDVVEEAAKHGGNIAVHKENGANVEMQWEFASKRSVRTIKDIFAEVVQDGANLIYKRLPVTPGGVMEPSHLDALFKVAHANPQRSIIFNCQTGRGRSSTAMAAACIVRFYQHCTQDIGADSSVMRGESKTAHFRSLVKFLTLLPKGSLHERRVAAFCDISGKISSLTDKMMVFLRDGTSRRGIELLRQYAILIAFSSFCEQRIWVNETDLDFSSWLKTMPEVNGFLHTLERRDSAAAAVERIATPDVDHSAEMRTVMSRRGQVLRTNMVLRIQEMDTVTVPSAVPGLTALRQIMPGVPVFTSGSYTIDGVEDLMNFVQTSSMDLGKTVHQVHWINIRAEPIVHIGKETMVVRDFNFFDDEDHIAMTEISGQRLEELEQALKADVLKESERDSTIMVHKKDADGNIKSYQMHIDDIMVLTPKEHLRQAEMSRELDFYYHRVPLAQAMTIDDIGRFLELVAEIPDNAAVVIADQSNGMRTTIALYIVTIARLWKMGKLRGTTSLQDLKEALGGTELPPKNRYRMGQDEELQSSHFEQIELKMAHQLCQMMASGQFLLLLENIAALCGRGEKWNVLEAINIFSKQSHGIGAANRDLVRAKALHHVKYDIFALLCALFLDTAKPNKPLERTLGAWCNQYDEIVKMLKDTERPEEALEFISSRVLMDDHVEEGFKMSKRTGNVLTSNYGIKADHFPGCQRKGMYPAIPGAPNFRKVAMVNVYGVAIPTQDAVDSVLKALGAFRGEPEPLQFSDLPEDDIRVAFPTRDVFTRTAPITDAPPRGRVVWLNLREEPIIYCNNRPMVFRDLAKPYVNVELTGIEANKVEFVEEELKIDVLNEAKQYDGRFLVHDEGKPLELVGAWEAVDEKTVVTVRSLYQQLADSGCRVTFVRLPVTDEQSPEYKDFDELVSHLLPELAKDAGSSEATSFIFNCQMGRGRTTTGMVICCLLIGTLYPNYFDSVEEQHGELWPADATDAYKGKYLVILRLLRVLGHGKEAKRRVDLVLEACSRMQNLRTAIEMLKTTAESAESNEEARGRAHHHGVHYLQRYFNLIAFTNYLFEEFDHREKRLKTTFRAWMEDRQELAHLHDGTTLE